MTLRWDRCLVHMDEKAKAFSESYFSGETKRALIVLGAGFDPRSVAIASLLAGVMGPRLSALVIREERGADQNADLREQADNNERRIRDLIPNTTVSDVQIFANDGAVIAGQRMVACLEMQAFDGAITDIVLDTSAMSVGVAFPAARYILDKCKERGSALNFHLMIASNPELDADIHGEPSDRTSIVKGYNGNFGQTGDDEVASLWLPQLSHRNGTALAKLRNEQDYYKICPILPFPSRNPRQADDLMSEYVTELLEGWSVAPRDIIYTSERNPVDLYRTLSVLKERFERTVHGHYTSQIVVSPLGSKVMAAGAMMAALEHDLTVKYVEALRYDFAPPKAEVTSAPDLLVHVWLHGYVYDGIVPASNPTTATAPAPVDPS